MKTNILPLGKLSLVALFALVFSCQDDLIEDNVTPNSTLDVLQDTDTVTLGKQLQNPYATEVMRQAAVNIDARVNIETTHLYVRFSPKTEEELGQLMRIKGKELRQSRQQQSYQRHARAVLDENVPWKRSVFAFFR
ncbi:MAG: hypothetical protein WA958_07015 [Tunicatimonas sp.]